MADPWMQPNNKTKYWENMLRKYEQRTARLQSEECDLRHKLEALECSLPIMLCLNVMNQGQPVSAPINDSQIPISGGKSNPIMISDTPYCSCTNCAKAAAGECVCAVSASKPRYPNQKQHPKSSGSASAPTIQPNTADKKCDCATNEPPNSYCHIGNIPQRINERDGVPERVPQQTVSLPANFANEFCPCEDCALLPIGQCDCGVDSSNPFCPCEDCELLAQGVCDCGPQNDPTNSQQVPKSGGVTTNKPTTSKNKPFNPCDCPSKKSKKPKSLSTAPKSIRPVSSYEQEIKITNPSQQGPVAHHYPTKELPHSFLNDNCECRNCTLMTSAKCECSPQPGSTIPPSSLQPQYQNDDLSLLDSNDFLIIEKVKNLAEKEKSLKQNINELHHKENALTETIEAVQFLKNTPMNNSNIAEDNEGNVMSNLQRLNNSLLQENSRMADELADVKLEMKQLKERVEGPMQRELEREKRKNNNMEDDLTRAKDERDRSEDSQKKETEFLKRQLDASATQNNDLLALNGRLKDELNIMDTKCNELHQDLINQKISEANTLSRIKAATAASGALPSANTNTLPSISPTEKYNRPVTATNVELPIAKNSEQSKKDSQNAGKNLGQNASQETPRRQYQMDTAPADFASADIPSQQNPIVNMALIQQEIPDLGIVSKMYASGETNDSIKPVLDEKSIVDDTNISQIGTTTKEVKPIKITTKPNKARDKVREGSSLNALARDLSDLLNENKDNANIPEDMKETANEIKQLIDVVDKKLTKPGSSGKDVVDKNPKPGSSGNTENAKPTTELFKRDLSDKSSEELSKVKSDDPEKEKCSCLETVLSMVAKKLDEKWQSKQPNKVGNNTKDVNVERKPRQLQDEPTDDTEFEDAMDEIPNNEKNKGETTIYDSKPKAVTQKDSTKKNNNNKQIKDIVPQQKNTDNLETGKPSSDINSQRDVALATKLHGPGKVQKKLELSNEIDVETELEADADVDVNTEVMVVKKNMDGINMTTTLTKSGTLEVITEGPAGIIETTMTLTDSGNIEVVTHVTDFDDVHDKDDVEDAEDTGTDTETDPSSKKDDIDDDHNDDPDDYEAEPGEGTEGNGTDTSDNSKIREEQNDESNEKENNNNTSYTENSPGNSSSKIQNASIISSRYYEKTILKKSSIHKRKTGEGDFINHYSNLNTKPMNISGNYVKNTEVNKYKKKQLMMTRIVEVIKKFGLSENIDDMKVHLNKLKHKKIHSFHNTIYKTKSTSIRLPSSDLHKSNNPVIGKNAFVFDELTKIMDGNKINICRDSTNNKNVSNQCAIYKEFTKEKIDTTRILRRLDRKDRKNRISSIKSNVTEVYGSNGVDVGSVHSNYKKISLADSNNNLENSHDKLNLVESKSLSTIAICAIESYNGIKCKGELEEIKKSDKIDGHIDFSMVNTGIKSLYNIALNVSDIIKKTFVSSAREKNRPSMAKVKRVKSETNSAGKVHKYITEFTQLSRTSIKQRSISDRHPKLELERQCIKARGDKVNISSKKHLKDGKCENHLSELFSENYSKVLYINSIKPQREVHVAVLTEPWNTVQLTEEDIQRLNIRTLFQSSSSIEKLIKQYSSSDKNNIPPCCNDSNGTYAAALQNRNKEDETKNDIHIDKTAKSLELRDFKENKETTITKPKKKKENKKQSSDTVKNKNVVTNSLELEPKSTVEVGPKKRNKVSKAEKIVELPHGDGFKKNVDLTESILADPIKSTKYDDEKNIVLQLDEDKLEVSSFAKPRKIEKDIEAVNDVVSMDALKSEKHSLITDNNEKSKPQVQSLHNKLEKTSALTKEDIKLDNTNYDKKESLEAKTVDKIKADTEDLINNTNLEENSSKVEPDKNVEKLGIVDIAKTPKLDSNTDNVKMNIPSHTENEFISDNSKLTPKVVQRNESEKKITDFKSESNKSPTAAKMKEEKPFNVAIEVNKAKNVVPPKIPDKIKPEKISNVKSNTAPAETKTHSSKGIVKIDSNIPSERELKKQPVAETQSKIKGESKSNHKPPGPIKPEIASVIPNENTQHGNSKLLLDIKDNSSKSAKPMIEVVAEDSRHGTSNLILDVKDHSSKSAKPTIEVVAENSRHGSSNLIHDAKDHSSKSAKPTIEVVAENSRHGSSNLILDVKDHSNKSAKPTIEVVADANISKTSSHKVEDKSIKSKPQIELNPVSNKEIKNSKKEGDKKILMVEKDLSKKVDEIKRDIIEEIEPVDIPHTSEALHEAVTLSPTTNNKEILDTVGVERETILDSKANKQEDQIVESIEEVDSEKVDEKSLLHSGMPDKHIEENLITEAPDLFLMEQASVKTNEEKIKIENIQKQEDTEDDKIDEKKTEKEVISKTIKSTGEKEGVKEKIEEDMTAKVDTSVARKDEKDGFVCTCDVCNCPSETENQKSEYNCTCINCNCEPIDSDKCNCKPGFCKCVDDNESNVLSLEKAIDCSCIPDCCKCVDQGGNDGTDTIIDKSISSNLDKEIKCKCKPGYCECVIEKSISSSLGSKIECRYKPEDCNCIDIVLQDDKSTGRSYNQHDECFCERCQCIDTNNIAANAEINKNNSEGHIECDCKPGPCNCIDTELQDIECFCERCQCIDTDSIAANAKINKNNPEGHIECVCKPEFCKCPDANDTQDLKEGSECICKVGYCKCEIIKDINCSCIPDLCECRSESARKENDGDTSNVEVCTCKVCICSSVNNTPPETKSTISKQSDKCICAKCFCIDDTNEKKSTDLLDTSNLNCSCNPCDDTPSKVQQKKTDKIHCACCTCKECSCLLKKKHSFGTDTKSDTFEKYKNSASIDGDETILIEINKKQIDGCVCSRDACSTQQQMKSETVNIEKEYDQRCICGNCLCTQSQQSNSSAKGTSATNKQTSLDREIVITVAEACICAPFDCNCKPIDNTEQPKKLDECTCKPFLCSCDIPSDNVECTCAPFNCVCEEQSNITTDCTCDPNNCYCGKPTKSQADNKSIKTNLSEYVDCICVDCACEPDVDNLSITCTCLKCFCSSQEEIIANVLVNDKNANNNCSCSKCDCPMEQSSDVTKGIKDCVCKPLNCSCGSHDKSKECTSDTCKCFCENNNPAISQKQSRASSKNSQLQKDQEHESNSLSVKSSDYVDCNCTVCSCMPDLDKNAVTCTCETCICSIKEEASDTMNGQQQNIDCPCADCQCSGEPNEQSDHDLAKECTCKPSLCLCASTETIECTCDPKKCLCEDHYHTKNQSSANNQDTIKSAPKQNDKLSDVNSIEIPRNDIQTDNSLKLNKIEQNSTSVNIQLDFEELTNNTKSGNFVELIKKSSIKLMLAKCVHEDITVNLKKDINQATRDVLQVIEQANHKVNMILQRIDKRVEDKLRKANYCNRKRRSNPIYKESSQLSGAGAEEYIGSVMFDNDSRKTHDSEISEYTSAVSTFCDEKISIHTYKSRNLRGSQSYESINNTLKDHIEFRRNISSCCTFVVNKKEGGSTCSKILLQRYSQECLSPDEFSSAITNSEFGITFGSSTLKQGSGLKNSGLHSDNSRECNVENLDIMGKERMVSKLEHTEDISSNSAGVKNIFVRTRDNSEEFSNVNLFPSSTDGYVQKKLSSGKKAPGGDINNSLCTKLSNSNIALETFCENEELLIHSNCNELSVGKINKYCKGDKDYVIAKEFNNHKLEINKNVNLKECTQIVDIEKQLNLDSHKMPVNGEQYFKEKQIILNEDAQIQYKEISDKPKKCHDDIQQEKIVLMENFVKNQHHLNNQLVLEKSKSDLEKCIFDPDEIYMQNSSINNLVNNSINSEEYLEKIIAYIPKLTNHPSNVSTSRIITRRTRKMNSLFKYPIKLSDVKCVYKKRNNMNAAIKRNKKENIIAASNQLASSVISSKPVCDQSPLNIISSPAQSINTLHAREELIRVKQNVYSSDVREQSSTRQNVYDAEYLLNCNPKTMISNFYHVSALPIIHECRGNAEKYSKQLDEVDTHGDGDDESDDEWQDALEIIPTRHQTADIVKDSVLRNNIKLVDAKAQTSSVVFNVDYHDDIEANHGFSCECIDCLTAPCSKAFSTIKHIAEPIIECPLCNRIECIGSCKSTHKIVIQKSTHGEDSITDRNDILGVTQSDQVYNQSLLGDSTLNIGDELVENKDVRSDYRSLPCLLNTDLRNNGSTKLLKSSLKEPNNEGDVLSFDHYQSIPVKDLYISDVTNINKSDDNLKELENIMRQISNACLKARSRLPPLAYYQNSSNPISVTSFKIALKNLQAKCQTNDSLIQAMICELQMQVNKEFSVSGAYSEIIGQNYNINMGNVELKECSENNINQNQNSYEAIGQQKQYKSPSSSNRCRSNYSSCLSSTQSMPEGLRSYCLSEEVINVKPLEMIEVKRIGEDSLLVKWKAPLSERILGYEVCVDEEVKTRVYRRTRTMAVITRIPLDRNPIVNISVYACTDKGRCLPAALASFHI